MKAKFHLAGIVALAVLSGAMAEPRFQVNPVSAIAPGILRKFFEFEGTCSSAQKSQKNGDKDG